MSAVPLTALKASTIILNHRMGEFGKIVNEAHCSALDTRQQFSFRGWESTQEGVAVVVAWTRSVVSSA